MHLLLVDPDAERLAETLAAHTSARLTAAGSAAAGRAYLGGTVFDAVLVRAGALDVDVRDAAARLALPTPLYTVADAASVRAWLAAHAPAAGAAPAATSASADLEAVRDEIARIVHALNNPLSVVLGNVQLGAELARATGADASVAAAFADAEEAAHRLHALFGEIDALRTRLGPLG